MRPVRWHSAGLGDTYAYYAHLRRHSPVIRAKIPTRGTGWVVTRYSDVLNVMKDSRFSNDHRHAANLPLFGFGGRFAPRLIKLVGNSMVCLDDPDHARLRRLVSKVFTPRSIDDMQPWVEGIVETMLDDMEKQAAPVELMSAFALPLPLKVISEMLGVPEDWRLAFHNQVVRLIEVNDKPVRRAMRWLPAMPKLLKFFEDLIELKQREPDDRLITRLIAVEDAGDHLSRDELIAMIFLLLFAGHETSVNLIGNGLLALLENPDQMALLRARPELMDGAVSEMLRYTSPVEYGAMRFATEDVVVADVTIGKGDMVMALLSSANRDETVFPDANVLDLTRADNRHLGLGFGLHYCLGASLARMEVKIAFAALLRRFPDLSLAVPSDKITWRRSSGLQGVEHLPILLGAAAPSAAKAALPSDAQLHS